MLTIPGEIPFADMPIDESIRFMPSGAAVVSLVIDRDLAQWLCRQSAHARTSAGIFVVKILREEILAHAKEVGRV
jgi:hypothetical protein